MCPKVWLRIFGILGYVAILTETGDSEVAETKGVLGGNACTKLQHEIQKGIILHNWMLENVKFQQRLKKFPEYIVTIQSIEPVHEPLVELRCPDSREHLKDKPDLEIYFHETRFQARSVRLFDIQSIFPIHTGSMSVKMKLEPLVVTLDKLITSGVTGGVVGQLPGLNDIYYSPSLSNSDYAKEHREDSGEIVENSKFVEVEKEIESIFMKRIKPDIQIQLRNLISSVVRKFFAQNLFLH